MNRFRTRTVLETMRGMKSLALFLALLPALMAAQRATINGGQHPELIPDSVAYRVVLIAHSRNSTPAEAAASEAKRGRIGLSSAGLAQYGNILTNFRTQYDALANTQAPGPTVAAAISALVARTRSELANLPAPDAAAFARFVQAEKAHMVTSEKGN